MCTPVLPKRAASAMRILVVEDMPEISDIIAEILTDGGHKVVRAEDAETGRTALLTGQYDAVICDVHLPNGSGLNVAEAALQEDTPVLLCTGDHLLADSLSHAGIPHLCKPFELTALTEWIDDMSASDQRRASVAAAYTGFAKLLMQMDRVDAFSGG